MDENIKEKSLDLIKRSFVGMLGTIDENGTPYIKAMIKTAADGLKVFWFCSNTSSKRVEQIKNNHKACLYFLDENSFEGLLLTGNVDISYDDNKRREFWQDEMVKYYPLGCNDPDYVLIKFTANYGNYYHGIKNYDFIVT